MRNRTTTTLDTRDRAALGDVAGASAEGQDGGQDRGQDGGLARGAGLSRYLVLERLGAGGMGEVYAAYDPELDRKVAVKVLRPELGRGSGGTSRRLLREAQALARLAHPNVVTVHDVGRFGDQLFLAMEFVEGTTLGRWLAGRELGWRETVKVFVEAGRGLAAAHAAGLVHRDFKPGNVMVGRDGRVRVLDFGLARLLDDDAGSGEESSPGSDPAVETAGDALTPPAGAAPLRATLTATGVAFGTPAFMAPEQHAGGRADARSDQFSFCVALYDALYGELPFAGASDQAYCVNVLRGAVRPAPASSAVPLWLRRVVLRGLDTDPAQRLPSMDALLAALVDDPAVRRRRWLAAAAAVVVVAGWWASVRLGSQEAGRCQGGERKWVGIWDEARAAQMRRAFLATGTPYAAAAWRESERLLDGYARGWSATYTEACEATHRWGQQSEQLLDRRMHCLEGRRAEVRALGELFLRADAEVAQNAVRAASSLSPLDGCANVPLLSAQVPLPRDEAALRELEVVRDRLAEVKAAKEAGKVERALGKARVTAPLSVEAGYAPLAAEAFWRLAELYDFQGDYAAAEGALYQALGFADQGRHGEYRARSAVSLVWLTGVRQDRYDEGRRWLWLADGTIRGLGGDAELELRRLDAAAHLHLAEGDYPAAAAVAAKVVEQSRELYGESHPETAKFLSSLGNAQFRLRQLPEALAAFERVADVRRRLFGDDHPLVSRAEQNVGAVLDALGRPREALPHLERALAILQASEGSESAGVAAVCNNLGLLFSALGDDERALAYQRRALAIRRRILEPGHRDVARSLSNMGWTLIRTGAPAEALEHLRQALALKEQSLGADHPELTPTLNLLGRAWLGAGDLAAAVASFERARRLAERQLAENGVSASELASALAGLGEVRLAQGRPASAMPLLERAVALLDGAAVTGPDLAQARFVLARGAGLSGAAARAKELALLAREEYARRQPGYRRELAAIDAWLRRTFPADFPQVRSATETSDRS